MMDSAISAVARGSASTVAGPSANNGAPQKADGVSGLNGVAGLSATDAVQDATPVQTESALREVNASLKAIGLEFEVDEDTDKMVVKVIDKETGETIRQMPSEEVIRIAKVLGKMQGMLVRETA
ncbi:FlaG protein [compost metagenome]